GRAGRVPAGVVGVEEGDRRDDARAVGVVVEAELQKLRIDKSHKARRDERPVWPWLLVAAMVLSGLGVGVRFYTAAAAPVVQTVRVKLPEPSAGPSQTVVLNATGYVMAAHKIELASKVVGRV